MDTTQVVSYLQGQFSGLMVLYVGDIAKVLGSSKQAISDLISRNDLPFKIKTVGSRSRVDIFQVAQWLASVEDSPGSVSEKRKIDALKQLPKSNRKKPTKSEKIPERGDIKEPIRGLMAAKILQMRNDYVDSMQRLFWSTKARRVGFPI